MLTEREEQLNKEQQDAFWNFVFDVVPHACLELIQARVDAGYNQEGYWRTYPFPHEAATLLTLKYVRVASFLRSGKSAEELLHDDVLKTNIMDMINYGILLLGVMLFLRSEAKEEGSP